MIPGLIQHPGMEPFDSVVNGINCRPTTASSSSMAQVLANFFIAKGGRAAVIMAGNPNDRMDITFDGVGRIIFPLHQRNHLLT